MKKEEFFKQLEYLLQDIPDEDREEALDYYRDYLAEAGSENEEQAIADFGSPERVAAIIRADAAGNLKDGGSFTETGYEDERFRDPNYQVARRLDLPEEKDADSQGKDGRDGAYRAGGYQSGGYQSNGYQSGGYQNGRYQGSGYQSGGYQNGGQGGGYQSGGYQGGGSRGENGYYSNGRPSGARDGGGPADGEYSHVERKPWSNRLLKVILWCVLIVVALPVAVGMAGAGLGGVTGILALIIGILVAVVCLTAGAVILGVILMVLGIVFLVSMPYEGLLLIGIGLMGLGCGVLGTMLLYAALSFLFPLIWKGIKLLIDWISGKGKEAGRS